MAESNLYRIGTVARLTGLSVRTIRFWSDAELVPSAGRTPAGHRLFDDKALGRLELVATLRGLGVGLETIRAVLERRTTVVEVATVHAAALDTEIRSLRQRRAVLIAIANRQSTTEEMRLVNELARLSSAERQRLVDDFIAATFGGITDDSGIGERMREVTPALPDDPSAEQVEAWVEVAELCQDPAFRDRVRRMAEEGARRHGEDGIDREAGKEFAHAVMEHVGPALAAGVDPGAPDAEPVVQKVLPGAGPARRAEVADLLATFTDERVDRYWQLVGTINGWPPFDPPAPAFQWLLRALRPGSAA